jgi:S-adenosylmethionine:tRNA ribosyltransferase-isomerase
MEQSRPGFIPTINTHELNYELPAHRIAEYPLPERDASQLMCVYPDGNQVFTHDKFYNLQAYLPDNSMLIINQTRVIMARLFMNKSTGGLVELLLIEPHKGRAAADAMRDIGTTQWLCLAGGKKVVPGITLTFEQGDTKLIAVILEKNQAEAIVEFQWQKGCFADILDSMGRVPLPPYIHRDADNQDKERYQTVYAKEDGSVAAPTAGLHFTDRVFRSLNKKGIQPSEIILHVGLGTFRPYDAPDIARFEMHGERISVPRCVIEKTLDFYSQEDQKGLYICVGTTSMRTMESIYWFGVRLIEDPQAWQQKEIEQPQWESYWYAHQGKKHSPQIVCSTLLRWMDMHHLQSIQGITHLMIVPGYSFGFTQAIITNFHQPESTLLFLVSAFLGIDLWREAYQQALDNHYRFLSYGDSSLLIRPGIRNAAMDVHS